MQGRELARFIVNLRVRAAIPARKPNQKGQNRLNGQQNILNIFNSLQRITLKG
jgi:hypothetical protein